MNPPRSVFASDTFARYHVTLAFTGKLAGGAPSDPDLVEGWLERNLGITDDEQLKRWTLQHLAETRGVDPREATDEEIQAAIEANAVEKKAQVFKRLPDGRPYIEARQIKALIKEATSIAYPVGIHKWGQYVSKSKAKAGQTVGGKAPRDCVAEWVFPDDQPVPVADEIAGVELAVGHIKDPRTGEKRSTIGYFEYVEQCEMSFALSVLDDRLEHDQWARIWTVAEKNGLGARRSQGCGQFVVTEFSPLDGSMNGTTSLAPPLRA